MHPTRSLAGKISHLTLTAALLLLASPATAAAGRAADRAALQAKFHALAADAVFQALAQAVDHGPHDPAALERLLVYMPISPLDYFQLAMENGHYETATPKYIHDWHKRWVELHPDAAAAIYGKEAVDALLAGRAAEGNAEASSLAEAASVGVNRNVATLAANAPDDYQGEIQIVVDPNDPTRMVAATNTWDTGMQSIFYSSDGGTTWGHTFPPLGTAFGLGSCTGFSSEFGSDPALAWSDTGDVFFEYMALCAGLASTKSAIVVARSSNGGASWSTQGVVVNNWANTSLLEDKEFYAIDNHAASPFHGRHYTCWDRNNDGRFAYSTNAGGTWTEVNLPNVDVDLGCEIAVADDGTVHVVWDTLTCSISTCSNERMFYARSTNGGVSFSTPTLVRDFNLVGFSGTNCPGAQDDRCIGPFGAVEVDNTGGACDGTLYATFGDFTAGGVAETDVWVSRSTNGGSTWGAPVKVNDDGLSGRIQFHPFLTVDPSNGAVVVAWHDARNDVNNRRVDFFVARSTDCGLTFETNIKVTAPSAEFNNNSITYSDENSTDNTGYNPNQYGEYLGLDARGGKAYVAWCDTRHYFPSFTSETQRENVGFAVVDFGTGAVCGNGVREAGEVCDGADLGGASCSDVGCGAGAPTCTASCTLDYGACSNCGACDNDSLCEAGEDCNNCPGDCASSSGASCGNGLCETADGESCLSCPADCNGKQGGKPSGRFCCGNAGVNPVGCADSRCTSSGFACTTSPSPASCCGDALCNGDESSCACAVDCGAPAASELVCNNGLDDDCDGLTDCADSNCAAAPECASVCEPVGANCTADADCCSNKCRGPNGGKTCR